MSYLEIATRTFMTCLILGTAVLLTHINVSSSDSKKYLLASTIAVIVACFLVIGSGIAMIWLIPPSP